MSAAIQKLNHDAMTDVVRFIGIFGDSAAALALVNKRWYDALASLFPEWQAFHGSFGLPESSLVTEKEGPNNYREAVVGSLRKAVEGDRYRIIMQPQKILTGTRISLARRASERKAGVVLPWNDWREREVWLIRTGGYLSSRENKKSTTLQGVDKVMTDNILTLGRTLRYFDLSSISSSAAISFLSKRSKPHDGKCLLSLDLSPLDPLTEVPDSFLSDFRSLPELDLSPIMSSGTTTTVGSSFLSGCRALTSLDLRPLSSATEVGESFMVECTSLTSLDLTSMSSVTRIGAFFLRGCASLTSVELQLSEVVNIPPGFLEECKSLTSVDLSSMTSLTRVSDRFLHECTALTSVNLSSSDRLTSIGECFMNECSSLQKVDLSCMTSVTELGVGFLDRCTSLASVDLSPLRSVTQVDRNFLNDFHQSSAGGGGDSQGKKIVNHMKKHPGCSVSDAYTALKVASPEDNCNQRQKRGRGYY